jgi:hypothetical protein
MSINFDKPVSPDILQKLEEHFGEPKASDSKTLLYDRMEAVNQRVMREIANAAKQPVIVEINGIGDRKTMEDGTEYEVTEGGWIQRDPL